MALSSNISHIQSERGRCSKRSANLGPGLARAPPNGRGLFLPWVRDLRRQRTCAADRTAARQWQRRTNVWRKVTNPRTEPTRQKTPQKAGFY